MRTLVYNEFLSSGDADILSGSEMEFAPGDGVYVIRAASTVNSATLAVNGNRSPIVSSARSIILRAGPESRAEDQPWVVAVQAGEKVVAALAGTTGTVIFNAQYAGS